MERQLSLDVLPIIIIDHVASYLDIEDIIACCATSPKMREAFSDDLIWKRHCDVERTNYLKRSVCLVEPHFEWIDDKFSKLSPVTGWKRNYMMQAHLFKNWRNERFEKADLEFGPVNGVYTKARIEFYENDYLFLHTRIVNESKFVDEIWDVAETPFLHSTFNLNSEELYGLSCDLFKIVNNKLVMGFRNLILVYDTALRSFSRIPLVHAFLFDMSEKCSKDIITHDENTFYRTTFCELAHQVRLIISGGNLVGAVTNFKDLDCPAFHVWDVETGKKIEDVSIPVSSINVEAIKFLPSDDSQNIMVQLRTVKDRYTFHCFGYDLSKMAFNSFSVNINQCDFLLLHKSQLVIGAAAERLYVYSYVTSEKLLIKKCTQQILKKTLSVVGNFLLFGTFENIVHVLDLSTLEVINKVKLGFTLYSLRSICNKFVVVNSVNSEVWEIGRTAKKLFKFPVNGSFLAVNKMCTKLAIEKENKIIILNFW